MELGNFHHSKDRYHMTMLEAAARLAQMYVEDQEMVTERAVFSASQRKSPYAIALGNHDLYRMMVDNQIDAPHARTLRSDRSGLNLSVEILEKNPGFPGQIYAVDEGTIIFANEPFANIIGPYGLAQAQEIKFQHAYDLNMTVAYRAMDMRQAAGEEAYISDFSLRRDNDYNRALQVAWASLIAGFNDTSNLDAAHELDVDATGTMAHHWVQRFIKYAREENYQIDPRTGLPKHFEQIAFEKWLDAFPDGTTCLPDAFGLKSGLRHLAMAATSTEQRRQALKNIRIDSGKNAVDYANRAIYAWELLNRVGLKGVGLILSGEMNGDMIRTINPILAAHNPPIKIKGWAAGTKLIAEVEFVVGVIFKLYQIGNEPTMKNPDTGSKATLPGELQVWRCSDEEGYYVKDILARRSEPMPQGDDFVHAQALLKLFWGKGAEPCARKSFRDLREIAADQRRRFRVPLEEYPVVLSPELIESRDKTITLIEEDKNDYSIIGL